ncbi:protein phosphatase 2C domain-containing protein [Phormidium yuhuli AB48]|uniref:Protein phosphatase 2C domain-containing protein n=1 Tax=Phormidium yuhuli AB48 TaxID=2940671 RepID=A0ABY5AMD6_9CYAN|nr:protein phosphatase 2C domain-containing protein [Phormidium yuhuli]USR89358.1 protein phosphatase 2C domain-containing protein [Phormidium yuhuli AB48]
MKPAFAGQTDKGLIRAVNQDAYHIDDAGRFFIVADGMGGHAAGQDASRIAKDAICHYLDLGYNCDDQPATLLKKAFLGANKAIMEDQLVHPENADMGTTAVAILLQPGSDGDIRQVWCANLGDSRIYRFRDGTLEQVTEDDTWVAQAIKAGVLPAEEAREHPWRHVLSQCLGREDMGELEIRGLDVLPGDQFLLCSDGLSEELTDDRIAAELAASKDCDEATTRLIEIAKAEGGRDNITVVLVKF